MIGKYLDPVLFAAVGFAMIMLEPGTVRSVALPVLLVLLVLRLFLIVIGDMARLRLVQDIDLSVGQSRVRQQKNLLYGKIAIILVLAGTVSSVIAGEWA